MNDGSSAPPDPLRAWLEATGTVPLADRVDDVPAQPRPRRLLAVTAGMTVAVVALALVAAARSSAGGAASPVGAAASPQVVPAAAPPEPAVAPSAPAIAPGPAAAPATPAAPAASATAPPSPAAAAAAVLAVRAAAGEGTYVDTAVVDGVEVRDDLTVVTVSAWVLARDGSRWDRGRAVRYGVAVSGQPRPTALARPWVLPPAPAQTPRLAWHAVNDARLRSAAARTLEHAGYRSVQRVEIARTEALPGTVRAVAAAIAPGAGALGEQEVWLSADARTVLGQGTDTDLPIPRELP